MGEVSSGGLRISDSSVASVLIEEGTLFLSLQRSSSNRRWQNGKKSLTYLCLYDLQISNVEVMGNCNWYVRVIELTLKFYLVLMILNISDYFRKPKSLWLEKASGKRCIMLSATAMNLSSMADMSQRFLWIPCPESRFETVAALREAYRFEFNCRMNTRVLSPRTRYSVYIVFKKADNWCGFKGVSIEAVVGIVGEESFRSFICFDTHGKGQARKRKVVAKPELREDGWMETEIGEFYNEGGLMSSDEVEISTVEGKYAQQKRGLVILGIEIRPAKILEEFSVCRL
ncbi:Phloem protein 2-like [Arabidopsis thaliana x Arabidopsis arenosa]|uniref:Phloem protein 2-like n=1 Tax=Arabidopsis thaliana x Arabidopsis arenosa TaxID=1240361 RepID=A0A8T2FJK9_9BRAS|nr:Phloem protein 2-like [Arabidopsis thaliana x Arabidopsis arenosa]